MSSEVSRSHEPALWRTPPDACNDLHFVVRDLQRTFLRIAANLRWYEHTWLGVPIWQLPDDLMALQRVVFDVNPTWIVETGTKFGGSAIFFASLLEMMGHSATEGGVITVDIQETREARGFLEERPHRFASFVRRRLIGDATAQETLEEIKAAISTAPGPVMVFLDDWHDGEHVYAELLEYSQLVTPGGILIVADTTFADLADTPVLAHSTKYRNPETSNPRVALERFLSDHPEFEVVTQYTSTGISNFPDSVLRKPVPELGAESR